MKPTAKFSQIEDELCKSKRISLVLSKCYQLLIRAEDKRDLLRGMYKIVIEDGGYRFVLVGVVEQYEKKTVQPIVQARFGMERKIIINNKSQYFYYYMGFNQQQGLIEHVCQREDSFSLSREFSESLSEREGLSE